MSAVCFYFQVHQPYRLNRFSYFDSNANYFDENANRYIMQKVAQKCYLPANAKIKELIDRHNGNFRVSYSISGVALEQMQEYAPEVLESFQDLARTGCVEFIAETYYHSLAVLYDKDEFKAQVKAQTDLVEKLFNYKPQIFRNTELIYQDFIGHTVADLGFKGIIAEGCDDVLGWRSPNFLYSVEGRDMPLLLKNYSLSDDIAFRFSQQSWKDFPLTADKFANWVHDTSGNGDIVNLFMDYETFGEHQWADTGIFEFLDHLPEKIMNHPDWCFKTPSEVIQSYPVRDSIHFHRLTSWADMERDITAWRGNRMQESALHAIYELKDEVFRTNDINIIHTWRKLLTSDHFYYMCTKWFSDGDVHAYFSPYESPYDAFVYFMNVLKSFKEDIFRCNRGDDSRNSL